MGRSKILSLDGKQRGPLGQEKASLRSAGWRISAYHHCGNRYMQYQLVQLYFCEDNAWLFNRQESVQYGNAGPTERHGGSVYGTLQSYYMHWIYPFFISITGQTCPLSSSKSQIGGKTSRQALRVGGCIYICIYQLSRLKKKQMLKNISFIKEMITPRFSLRWESGREDSIEFAQSNAGRSQEPRS